MSGASGAVVVMAKAPRAGNVKTRLSPLLGPGGCAALQAALLRQAATTACACAPGSTYLALHPPSATRSVATPVPGGVRVFAQEGANLGERMASAVAHVAAFGHGRVVVVGTDVPQLGAEHLEHAFAQLEKGCDVVFGPALDGGYYLVGLSTRFQAVFGIDPDLWGGPLVLDASVAVAEAGGLAVGFLDPLRDLDTPADVVALLAGSALPEEIRQLLCDRSSAPSR